MPVVINGTTGITNVNGSAAAPAETGTDTDTGIYYGTNTVGIATNGTAALQIDSSQNVSLTAGLAVAGNNISAVNSMGFRNRIINGAMVIDQRNNGAAVTHSGGSNLYVLDRWVCNSTGTPQFSVQRVTDAPAGFINSSKLTTTTAGTPAAGDFSYYGQYIEGFNSADLNFGTASALTVTVSFWVKSSLTGTFGGTLKNGDANRAYPFSYTINSASTWEYKTVTIPGDTTGTWSTDNNRAVTLLFDTGSGANNKGTAGAWNATANIGVTGGVNLVATASATWYITGVQLEAGSVATPFERRDYGRELMMCQRYYWRESLSAINPYGRFGNGSATSTTVAQIQIKSPVSMRAVPSGIESGGTLALYDGVTVINATAVAVDTCSTLTNNINVTVASGLTQFRPYQFLANNSATAYFGVTAEL